MSIIFKIEKYKIPHKDYFKHPPENVKDFMPFNIKKSRILRGYHPGNGNVSPISEMILQYMEPSLTPFVKKIGLNEDIITLESVYVDEKYRKQGICKKMLIRAIKYTREKTNASRIFVFAHEENIPAVKCYSSVLNTQLTSKMKKYLKRHNSKIKDKNYKDIVEVLKKTPQLAAKYIMRNSYLFKEDENLMTMFYLKIKMI